MEHCSAKDGKLSRNVRAYKAIITHPAEFCKNFRRFLFYADGETHDECSGEFVGDGFPVPPIFPKHFVRYAGRMTQSLQTRIYRPETVSSCRRA